MKLVHIDTYKVKFKPYHCRGVMHVRNFVKRTRFQLYLSHNDSQHTLKADYNVTVDSLFRIAFGQEAITGCFF